MNEYVPYETGTVTKYVVVESPTLTPSELAIHAYEISRGVIIKETCYGLAINGKMDEVEGLIAQLRTFDPDHIFVKDRGFPTGDPRRCRSNLGGARPGFHGIEFETTLLPLISHGLEEIRTHDPELVPPAENPLDAKKLDVNILKKLIEAQEP